MGYNTKIDWCDTSWNPVTGCYHNCEYCYARGIANRFGGYQIDPVGDSIEMRVGSNGLKGIELSNPVSKVDKTCAVRVAPYPFGFIPTLHKYRLDEPSKWTSSRTIFVCSMADLFGEWVPESWIKSVFDSCAAAPQHRYLFLTKNPDRYYDLGLQNPPDNVWLGSSYTGAEKYRSSTVTKNRFISVEPLLSEIHPLTANAIAIWNDWVIIGAETGKRKDKVKPEKEWVNRIVRACAAFETPVFMKESLRELMGEDFIQQYPWGDPE